MTEILGIDLGTTNSAVAIWRDGKPQIIPDADGFTLTPSVIAIDPVDGKFVVGRRAYAIANENPLSTIYSIKRLMGRRYQDDLVQEQLHSITYEVEDAKRGQGGIQVKLGDKSLTPQQVSAKILQKLKADATAFLGYEVTQAVITVPAYFHDSQRQATRDAGRLAGLDVKRVLNEPTAACLAFGYEKLAQARQKIAVYDLGGGTFDISILEVGRGPFRVRSTSGNTQLGGDDLDCIIIDWILTEVAGKDKSKLQADLFTLANLRHVAEKAKVDLSIDEKVSIQIPELISQNLNLSDSSLTLTRTQLEAMTEDLIAKTLISCRQALQDARLKIEDIQEVLLVGGQTRMPVIRNAVQNFFGKEPNLSLNPEEVVALGAAVQAAIIAGMTTGLVLADVVPLTLGVSTKGRMDTIIPRNTSIPIVKTKEYTTAYDNQESVEIQIYQGERLQAIDNIKLAEFVLSGIEPSVAGEPKIEVTFRVDQDSILHVSGKDLRTGNFKEITITDSVRLSEDEIAEIIRDADNHAVEDTAKRQQLEMEEQAKQLVKQLQKLMDSKKEILSSELMDKIVEVIALNSPEDWKKYMEMLKNIYKEVNDYLHDN